MKQRLLLCFIIFQFFGIGNNGLSGQIALGYEIGTWRGFSDAAVSYTWDDNTAKQLTVAKPIFDQFDFKMTFFVTTNWSPNWSGFQEAVLQGHEVASHSKSHPNFGNLNVAQRADEMSGAKDAINTQIMGNHCLTFAYPFCAVGDDTQTAEYYISARTCQGQIESSTPNNIMQVSSIICGTEGPIKSSNDFDNKVNSAIASNGWVVFLLHGIDNDGGYSPIESSVLQTHLEYMNEHRDELWIASYGEAVKYIKERDSSALVELSNTNNMITLEVTHGLSDVIYNVPISIQRIIPIDWQSATVTQDGNAIESKIIEVDNEKFLQFDVIPNGGTIVINGSGTVEIQNNESDIHSIRIFPNPSGSVVTLEFSLLQKAEVSLTIVDNSGRLFRMVTKRNFTAGKYQVNEDISDLKNEIYYFVFTVNGLFQTKQIITN